MQMVPGMMVAAQVAEEEPEPAFDPRDARVQALASALDD